MLHVSLAASDAATKHPHIVVPVELWVGFVAGVIVLVLLDLFVLHRGERAIGIREAIVGSLFWVGISLGFNAWLWVSYGHVAGTDFLTAYLVEKSLSVDNLFVFLMIFTAFGVHREHQHHVLFYGIVGALVMRAVFIIGGAALLERFTWLIYVFAGLLLWAAIKTLLPEKEDPGDPSQSWVVRLTRMIVPISKQMHGGKFVVHEEVPAATPDGKPHMRRMFTPLLVVLVLIEFSDILFAVDSIPAVLAITTDPFVAFSSNVMAVLGLRALYFALSGMLSYVQYLRYGLGVILAFVAAKMILHEAAHITIPAPLSLGIIVGVLILTVIISRLQPVKEEAKRTVVLTRAVKSGTIRLERPLHLSHSDIPVSGD